MAYLRSCLHPRAQRPLILLLAICFLLAVGLGLWLLAVGDSMEGFGRRRRHPKDISLNPGDEADNIGLIADQAVELSKRMESSKPKEPAQLIHGQREEASSALLPEYRVHAFYYPWYGNPSKDGHYLHWDHPYILHWNKQEAERWPKGKHTPPGDIGANFYPALGEYSSRDPEVIEDHIKQMLSANIGVVSVSWYPPGHADDHGHSPDSIVPLILDAAHKHQLKVCLHIEPYKGRDAESMKKNLEYIIGRYGEHPALYRLLHKGRNLPLYYIYDSYMVPVEEWEKLLRPGGTLSIRGTELDGVMIGLLVEEKHKRALQQAAFDGFYTYFASHGFTYGSNTMFWRDLANFAKASEMIFIPSVGPGYIDTRVRPWNGMNTKDRKDGRYYEESFRDAVAVKPELVSITSFNEWHEGTQIEKAVPKQHKQFTYLDYEPHAPDYYLSLTRKWVFKYRKLTKKLTND